VIRYGNEGVGVFCIFNVSAPAIKKVKKRGAIMNGHIRRPPLSPPYANE